MNSIFMLMMAANIGIADVKQSTTLPFKAYSTYEYCDEAAKFYTDNERLPGISYYCSETKVVR